MRLIDVDELWKNAISNYDECIGLDELLELIDKLPTIDAVPVVQCKDCKYFNVARELKHYPNIGMCDWFDELAYSEGYCSFAERRINNGKIYRC